MLTKTLPKTKVLTSSASVPGTRVIGEGLECRLFKVVWFRPNPCSFILGSRGKPFIQATCSQTSKTASVGRILQELCSLATSQLHTGSLQLSVFRNDIAHLPQGLAREVGEFTRQQLREPGRNETRRHSFGDERDVQGLGGRGLE